MGLLWGEVSGEPTHRGYSANRLTDRRKDLKITDHKFFFCGSGGRLYPDLWKAKRFQTINANGVSNYDYIQPNKTTRIQKMVDRI